VAPNLPLDEIQEQAEAVAQNFTPKEDDAVPTAPDPDEEEPISLPADMYTSTNNGQRKAAVEFDGALSGESLVRVSEDLIKKLSVKSLAIFELGRKFSQEMAASKKGKFKPETSVQADKDDTRIVNPGDLSTLVPSQHGLPSEIFDAKQDQTKLVKARNIKREEKKKLLYLLIDVSGSMSGYLGGDAKNGLYTRNCLSSLFSIACAERVRDDKGVLFSRFFAGCPTNLTTSETPAEFEHHIKLLSLPSCTSASTNIAECICYACNDIATMKGQICSSEILLITDCEDHIDEAEIRNLIKTTKVELNTLDVAGGSINSGAAASLRAVSFRYYKANEREPDITKIVSLL
jgi:hypothetical protein